MSAAATAATLTIRVKGCPDPALSSNSRLHWRVKARAVKQARGDAKYVTKFLLGLGGHAPDHPTVNVVIAWGHNRQMADATNLWAFVKPHIDGIADALEVNDKTFAVGTIDQIRAPKGDLAGYVELALAAA